jgi:hypothetical protein
MDNKNDQEKRSQNKIGMGLVIGIGLGVAIGVATDNLAVWIGIGAAIGMALGAGWDLQAKNRDKSHDEE